jgi:protease I
MQKPLAGKTVAVLVASGFEEIEMTEPQKALLALGAAVKLVGPESLANGWHGDAWGHYFPVDQQIGTMLSADYDMLLVPGGARSLIKLGQSAHTKRIVSAFIDDQKPVALIGHGAEVLVIAERAQGVTVSAAPDARAALEAAGATLSDEAILVSGNVLSADGTDLPRFIQDMITLFVGEEAVKDAA